MRNVILAAVLIIALSLSLAAQQTPKAEVFGGYSFFHAGLGPENISDQSANGWNGSFTGNVNSWLGVTADFSGQYKSVGAMVAASGSSTPQVKVHLHNFLFGPTVSYRSRKATPFARLLLGVSRESASLDNQSDSRSGFAFALGGGMDVQIAKVFSIRVGQVDYVRTHFDFASHVLPTWQNNVRFASGVVLNLGRK
jgi:opacity protein-like surface antigen